MEKALAVRSPRSRTSLCKEELRWHSCNTWDFISFDFPSEWLIFFIIHEQYTPSTPWLAASHLASGCNKTRETSISTGCNIHQMTKKVSDAVPVHAVQVSVVNKCKMWFSLRGEKKKRHAEQNVASGNVLVCISLFPFFVFYSMTSSRAHIKFVDNLKFSSFPSLEFGGGVSATWNNEMSFLKLAVFFSLQACFGVFCESCGTFISRCAHVLLSYRSYRETTTTTNNL